MTNFIYGRNPAGVSGLFSSAMLQADTPTMRETAIGAIRHRPLKRDSNSSSDSLTLSNERKVSKFHSTIM